VTTSQPKPLQQPEPIHNSSVHEKTGLEFVRIPAGEFLYGNDKKSIKLPEYWISKTPVTQTVYQRFMAANSKQDLPLDWDKQKRIFPNGKAEHPVNQVNWYDALAFCEWAGLQLPTEEQWEKAARGTDGRIYPWGDNEPTDKLCNFNKNVGSTTPVGQYSPQGDSPFGCVDMSGNVWEWCLNKYKTPEVTEIDQSEAWRVLRGGAWFNFQDDVRAAYRDHYRPASRFNSNGFRVVAVRPPSQGL
jgi:formylglycine-generating enzyme required for sulfatase activity